MIDVTSAQLDAWLNFVIWPLARILALIATAPVIGSAQFPTTAKIGLAVLLTVLIAPTLTPAAVDPGGASGITLLVREMLLGIAMGLTMRVIFSAVEMAGDFIGLQMGLGFAQFYDPQTNAQVPVLGQFLGMLTSLTFLSLNGHLLLISTLVASFQSVPASGSLPANWMLLVQWGSMVLQIGVLLSLPLVAALLITNAALAILTRAAPALNLFAIGFPVTLTVGFIGLLLTLPYFIPILERSFEQGLQMMLRVSGS